MASLDAISIAFDMNPNTGTLFGPEPFTTVDILAETPFTVFAQVQGVGGQQFFLQAGFFVVSPSEIELASFMILDTNSAPQAFVLGVDAVVSANADVSNLLRSSNLAEVFSGNDSFDGSDFNDVVFGFSGADFIIGRGGNDIAYGNQGIDVIYGNQGNDILFGGRDFDFVFGGQGADAVYGNLEDDLLYGNLGNDVVFGGQGDDVLYGGQGDDVMLGNLGNDILIGNRGNDQLSGGAGSDSFHFAPNSGNDVITDFETDLDFIFVDGTGADITQQGSDSLITLTSGDTVLVLNITVGDLTDDVFFV